MFKHSLLKHRFTENSDYNVSYTLNGQRVSLTIPNILASEVNNYINIDRELVLTTNEPQNGVAEIEDTFEEDLRSIRANMVETMGFSDIRFPIIENIGENDLPNDTLRNPQQNKFSNSIFSRVTTPTNNNYRYRLVSNRLIKGRILKHKLLTKKTIPNYIKYDRRVTYLNRVNNLIHTLFGLSHGQI